MLDFEFGWKLLQGLLGLILEGLDSRVVNWQVQPATPGESTQEFEGRCGIFSSSSSQTPSAELTVNTAFLSACFFCTLSPHAASFFGSTAAVGDEYSRTALRKNKDKGKDREKT
ncbi:hypothetical protein ACFX2I_012817 [Malus domestica]